MSVLPNSRMDKVIKGAATIGLMTFVAVNAENIHYEEFRPACILESLSASTLTYGFWKMFGKFADNAKEFANLPHTEPALRISSYLAGNTLRAAFRGTGVLFGMSLLLGNSSHMLHRHSQQDFEQAPVTKKVEYFTNNQSKDIPYYF